MEINDLMTFTWQQEVFSWICSLGMGVSFSAQLCFLIFTNKNYLPLVCGLWGGIFGLLYFESPSYLLQLNAPSVARAIKDDSYRQQLSEGFIKQMAEGLVKKCDTNNQTTLVQTSGGQTTLIWTSGGITYKFILPQNIKGIDLLNEITEAARLELNGATPHYLPCH